MKLIVSIFQSDERIFIDNKNLDDFDFLLFYLSMANIQENSTHIMQEILTTIFTKFNIDEKIEQIDKLILEDDKKIIEIIKHEVENINKIVRIQIAKDEELPEFDK